MNGTCNSEDGLLATIQHGDVYAVFSCAQSQSRRNPQQSTQRSKYSNPAALDVSNASGNVLYK